MVRIAAPRHGRFRETGGGNVHSRLRPQDDAAKALVLLPMDRFNPLTPTPNHTKERA